MNLGGWGDVLKPGRLELPWLPAALVPPPTAAPATTGFPPLMGVAERPVPLSDRSSCWKECKAMFFSMSVIRSSTLSNSRDSCLNGSWRTNTHVRHPKFYPKVLPPLFYWQMHCMIGWAHHVEPSQVSPYYQASIQLQQKYMHAT